MVNRRNQYAEAIKRGIQYDGLAGESDDVKQAGCGKVCSGRQSAKPAEGRTKKKAHPEQTCELVGNHFPFNHRNSIVTTNLNQPECIAGILFGRKKEENSKSVGIPISMLIGVDGIIFQINIK